MLSFNDNRDWQNGGASFRSAYVESVDKLKLAFLWRGRWHGFAVTEGEKKLNYTVFDYPSVCLADSSPDKGSREKAFSTNYCGNVSFAAIRSACFFQLFNIFSSCQHIFRKNTVAAGWIINEHMRYCTHQFTVLYYRTAWHECVKWDTTFLQLF